jgi:hypothetical protein
MHSSGYRNSCQILVMTNGLLTEGNKEGQHVAAPVILHGEVWAEFNAVQVRRTVITGHLAFLTTLSAVLPKRK